MKTMLFLEGGYLQCFVINKAKHLGYQGLVH